MTDIALIIDRRDNATQLSLKRHWVMLECDWTIKATRTGE
jgi:hypothetical protein